jgi:hypothetical protein
LASLKDRVDLFGGLVRVVFGDGDEFGQEQRAEQHLIAHALHDLLGQFGAVLDV